MKTEIKFTPDASFITIHVTSIEPQTDEMADEIFAAAVEALKNDKYFSDWIIFEGAPLDDFTTIFHAEPNE
jgi:hypothetical protein